MFVYFFLFATTTSCVVYTYCVCRQQSKSRAITTMFCFFSKFIFCAKHTTRIDTIIVCKKIFPSISFNVSRVCFSHFICNEYQFITNITRFVLSLLASKFSTEMQHFSSICFLHKIKNLNSYFSWEVSKRSH